MKKLGNVGPARDVRNMYSREILESLQVFHMTYLPGKASNTSQFGVDSIARGVESERSPGCCCLTENSSLAYHSEEPLHSDVEL